MKKLLSAFVVLISLVALKVTATDNGDTPNPASIDPKPYICMWHESKKACDIGNENYCICIDTEP